MGATQLVQPNPLGCLPVQPPPGLGLQWVPSPHYPHRAEEPTLRELIERYAEDRDIEFLPKVGRVHEGLQVYYKDSRGHDKNIQAPACIAARVTHPRGSSSMCISM